MEYTFTSRIRVRRVKVRGRTYLSYYIVVPAYAIKAYGIPIKDLVGKEVKVTVAVEEGRGASQGRDTAGASTGASP